MPEFQDVDIPQGTFIGWGRKGQTVTVKVLSFDPVGGTDANGKVCPQLIGELTEPCESWRDRGATRQDLAAGEMVTVSASIHQLKAGLLAADPNRGDIVRMIYLDDYTTKNGSGKTMKVQIARGAGIGATDDVV